ncbi:SigB/SigF/SigG family RNA polymerase sigma factor [Actinorugispora endophytica]|uniref:RNA polymerase sigma-37 (RpsB/SigB) subunit n=1 Tax=Actinorugispora endophytica TaxID=1605990 RepID=A0A4R6UWD2_9ACTN|nr:SigB/SigF/SigG family RNA polymerase sigma factor [Actinorugispora endophytica]TDQ51561.1 RNA polymerase sigma-37 (RpsB/SigB) subunit [Actinorugispora endophytica]
MSVSASHHGCGTSSRNGRRVPPNRHSDDAYLRQTRELLEELGRVREDPDRRERIYVELTELHTPVARRIARQYRNRGEPEEDLRQVAMVGLYNAIRNFDPAYGKEFISYALPMMTGEVKRHFRDRTWAVRVPRKHQERRAELNRVTAEFAQRNGRSPTVRELAVLLELDEEETLELIDAARAYSTLSLDVPFGADEDGTTLGDTLGGLDEALERVVDHATLRPALAALPARDRRILLLRFAGDKTQAQIAELVGLSQMHVSRRLAAILATLRGQLVPDQ